MDFEIRQVKEHYEIFLNGEFQFSADNLSEIIEEVERMGL